MVENQCLAVNGPYTLKRSPHGRPCFTNSTLVGNLDRTARKREWVQDCGECASAGLIDEPNTGRVRDRTRGEDIDLHCDFKHSFAS